MENDNSQPDISEAEKRRNRRRQKILSNAEGRIQRIVGADETGEKLKAAYINGETSVGDGENMARKRTNKEKLEKPASPDSFSTSFSSQNQITSISTAKEKTRPVLSSGRAEDISSPRPTLPVTLEDGTTLHPKIPAWVGRVFVCFLGVILSVFNGKYFLVTFFSWEVAFLGINGLPTAPPPGIFLALVAIIGLKEPHLQRLRFITQLLNTLITDLSLFVIAALLPRVILKM